MIDKIVISDICLKDYEEKRTSADRKEAYDKFVEYINSLGLARDVVDNILTLEAEASEEFETEYFKAGFEYGKKLWG